MMITTLALLAAAAESKQGVAPGDAFDSGVRLSLDVKPGILSVTWQTNTSVTSPTLRYGRTPTVLDTVVAANSSVLSNWDKASKSHRSVSVHSAFMHAAFGVTVFYQVSGGGRVFNLTQRTPHGIPAPTTFALFGDLGIKEQEGANYTLARLLEHHARRDFDMILHVGDIAYDLRENGGRTGDEFTANMEPISSQVPYMVCPGNHERDCPHSHGCDPPYTNYRKRFRMPSPASKVLDAGHQPMWWSADVGFAHIVSINTDVYYYPNQLNVLEAQWHWLQADLHTAAMNRGVVPWIVVIGHEMLYSTHDASHAAQAKSNREGPVSFHGSLGLEGLFKNYSVDLYFSGHEHVYEHFARIYDSHVCTHKDVADSHCGLPPPCPCTAHIVVGNAGDREFPYHTKNGTIMPFAYPQPPWEHFRATSPAGFGLLHVNASTMLWRQYNARTDAVIDEHVYRR